MCLLWYRAQPLSARSYISYGRTRVTRALSATFFSALDFFPSGSGESVASEATHTHAGACFSLPRVCCVCVRLADDKGRSTNDMATMVATRAERKKSVGGPDVGRSRAGFVSNTLQRLFWGFSCASEREGVHDDEL